MKKLLSLTIIILLIGLYSGCGSKSEVSVLQERVDSLQTALKAYTSDQAITHTRLTRFDSLDFNFYSNQQWDQLAISHDAGIQVFYPDGSMSLGLPSHIDQLKPLFVFAPDTKITNHRVKFGSGDWTAVIGDIQGTFTQPMPLTGTEGSKTIPPTNKPFKFSMCTIGHWKEGKMTEEYLFWDNQAFMKQIGL